MRKIMLSIYPDSVITDIDLGVIRERMEFVLDWAPELHDARVSDAAFVNVILQLPSIGADEVGRLREVFDRLPRMRTSVWRGFGVEVPLGEIDEGTLEMAAEAFSRL